LCGLSPDEFRHYTPAEFKVLLDAKIKDRELHWRMLDRMNALQCCIIAQCAGNSDAKPTDFETIKWETEEKNEPEAPATIADKLRMLTLSMGGKIIKQEDN
jgi:hypothetical protein